MTNAGKYGDSSVLNLPLRPKPTLNKTPKAAGGPESGLRLILSAAELHEMALRYSQSLNRFEMTRNELRASVEAGTAQLAKTQQHLAVVLDSISEGIIAFDEHGQIQSFNRSAQQIFGCDEPDAIGSEIGRFFGNDFLDSDICREPTEMIVSTGSGQPIRVEFRAKHMITDTGCLTVLTVRDITDVKYTQKLLKEQAFLVENSHSFMLTFNKFGTIEWCNPCFEELTGFRLHDLMERKPGELLANRFAARPLLRQISSVKADESAFKAELEICHARGRYFWVSVEAHPMVNDDGSLEKFVALGVDITERKKNEAMHVDFISMVSHELRTPLTVVSGAFDALSWGMGGKLSDTHKELIDMGRRNCEHLTVLIEDLIDVNKLEAGTVKFHSHFVDIREPIESAVATVKSIADDKKIKLQMRVPDSSAIAFVDPQRLHQVLLNLLSNAIKFSPACSTVKIGLFKAKQRLSISIEDEGPGIPEAFKPRVFERFAREPTVEASGTDGFGLGLCISKGLVEQMSGSISFRSDAPSGTVFEVSFSERMEAA